jgi:hypothetical protein
MLTAGERLFRTKRVLFHTQTPVSNFKLGIGQPADLSQSLRATKEFLIGKILSWSER